MIGLKKLRGKTTKKEKDRQTDGPFTTRTAQAWRECQALSNNASKSGVWPTSDAARNLRAQPMHRHVQRMHQPSFFNNVYIY
jgi:hypothetical protein